MLQGLRLPSAPIQTPEGVVFTIAAPSAKRVQLAGDFNSWIPEGADMQFWDGVWQAVIPLSPGRYRYRYIVDGQWQSDPLNFAVEPTPYGGFNSVFVLDGVDK